MNKKNKKEGLGKGIRALLDNIDIEQNAEILQERRKQVREINDIHINDIDINPHQPRNEFEENALNELSQSIKIHGIIQPVTVRKMGPKKFQLISGERRLRASRQAGLETIPAYVRTATDIQILEWALIENIQRENLNAIEIALSYQHLLDECNITHEELAERVGKDRSTVTNYLRLLKLPPEIQIGLKKKAISMGHARAFLATDDVGIQLTAYTECISKRLSVRKVEQLMKELIAPKTAAPKRQNVGQTVDDREWNKVEERLTDQFDTTVRIKRKSNDSGDVVFSFDSQKDFNRLLDLLE